MERTEEEKKKFLINLLDKVFEGGVTVNYDEFNSVIIREKEDNLINLESKYNELGITKKGNVTLLSLIATITEVLIGQRLAFKVEDDGTIVGVAWHPKPTEPTEMSSIIEDEDESCIREIGPDDKGVRQITDREGNVVYFSNVESDYIFNPNVNIGAVKDSPSSGNYGIRFSFDEDSLDFDDDDKDTVSMEDEIIETLTEEGNTALFVCCKISPSGYTRSKDPRVLKILKELGYRKNTRQDFYKVKNKLIELLLKQGWLFRSNDYPL